MHQMKFKSRIKNRTNKAFFSTVLRINVLVLLVTIFSTSVYAENPKIGEPAKPQPAAPLITSQTHQDIKIEKPRPLLSENTPIKREIEIIDSLMFEKELEEEEEFMIPAEDIYQSWNNINVNPYSNIVIPDTFMVDLSSMTMPIDDEVIRITSKFGPRKRRMHKGIDLKVQVGDTIRAVCDGKVRVKRFEKRGYGYFLVLRHPNGMETVYGHLSKFLVEENDVVKAGQAIALGGNTGRSSGSHLHLETRLFGEALNPAEFFDFENKVMHIDSYVFHKGKTPVNKYTGNGTGKITYHRIKQGDTLGSIARKHGMTVNELCRLNKITTKTTLRIGRSLRCS